MAGTLAAVTASAAECFVPESRVRPDDYTVLMAVDAPLPESGRVFQAGGQGKFFVQDWKRTDQVFAWTVTVPAEGSYAVNLLACRDAGVPLEAQVACGNQSVQGIFSAPVRHWDRQALAGELRLAAGNQVITLSARCSNFAASVLSIELVRPAVRDALQTAAQQGRADTTWFQRARYGLMVHWTSQSAPRHGPRKSYAYALQAFDVEGFADQVQATGAGFLVFTTSHAEMYLPAPIASLDRILPGRTASRDLIADLADSLGRRGIKLMLYYHLGSGSDPAWLRASGFWATDTGPFFTRWQEVIGEMGTRYGDKLAGWWFDDGAVTYYHRNAPWADLTRAAKAGHAQRLVGYNPWILPSPTAFQDFFCGEGFGEPGGDGVHAIGGDGRYVEGSHAGLQAAATLVTEQDWGHFNTDREIGPPRWNAETLQQRLQQFAAHRNVPIFNVEIYQEGRLSPVTVDLFAAARKGGTP